MPDLELENLARIEGATTVAGIDEAGRGPLAGPVVAAAVILPDGFVLNGLNDSKKLSPKKRKALFESIVSNDNVKHAIASATVEEIEHHNILAATHLAMKRVASALAPDHCLIDGLPLKDFPYPHQGVIKGDSKSLSIAAASILAKVSRDRMMKEIDAEFPQYGFAQHKGYGTAQHLEALRTDGPCRHHRRTFQPVAQLSLPLDQ